jgi:prepilin-type N-terminal cleavage/methylation domain-containing protein
MQTKEKKRQTHKGFSLIELLIVILIISVVYFLGFSGFEKSENKPKALTPLNLKSTIMQSEGFHGEMTLICADKCQSCYMRKGVNGAFQPYENKVDLKNIEAYTVDHANTIQQLNYGRYKDKKICLAINFYHNGSSTQIILKNEESIYFLPSFFEEPQKVDSLEDAKELWLKNSDLLSNNGDFY